MKKKMPATGQKEEGEESKGSAGIPHSTLHTNAYRRSLHSGGA